MVTVIQYLAYIVGSLAFLAGSVLGLLHFKGII
jgi:hypothetical protein